MQTLEANMKIVDVKARALSVPVEDGAVLGIGKVLRRDTVLVRVETEGGLVGYGESHHGRAAGSVAHIVNSLLRYFLIGEDARDVVGTVAEDLRDAASQPWARRRGGDRHERH
jgi:L-alanine-DL-glutamate epimerase-like enolase superfamily enzyme